MNFHLMEQHDFLYSKKSFIILKKEKTNVKNLK